MKKMKRITALLLAAMLLLSAVLTALPVEQAYADERQELEKELSDAEQRAKEYKKQIEALQDDKNAALEKKMLLDQRNEVLKEQIKTVNKQIGAHVISPGGPRDCPWGPTRFPLGAHVIVPGGKNGGVYIAEQRE